MSSLIRVRKLRKLWNSMGKTSMGGISRLICPYLDLREVKVVEGDTVEEVREEEREAEEVEEGGEVVSLDLAIEVSLDLSDFSLSL